MLRMAGAPVSFVFCLLTRLLRSMALHRDIYWVGRQWAVTGFGVQAVDQRLKGTFDIEIARLWEDGLQQRMRALAWLKADDFDKALDIARARHPEPPRKSLPLVESILEMIPPAGRGEVPKPPASPIEASRHRRSRNRLKPVWT